MFSPVVGLHAPERKHLFFKGPFSVGPLKWKGAASTSVVTTANIQKESVSYTAKEKRARDQATWHGLACIHATWVPS